VTTGFLISEKFHALHTNKANEVSRAAETLRLLPDIYVSPHAQDTLCISAVKLTGTSLDTSYAAVPHSHLWGHYNDRYFLFSLKVALLYR